MYSGNNPIAIRSQECLSDALLDLMKENVETLKEALR